MDSVIGLFLVSIFIFDGIVLAICLDKIEKLENQLDMYKSINNKKVSELKNITKYNTLFLRKYRDEWVNFITKQ